MVIYSPVFIPPFSVYNGQHTSRDAVHVEPILVMLYVWASLKKCEHKSYVTRHH